MTIEQATSIIEPGEFYRQRDARTSSMVGDIDLAAAEVVISISQRQAETFAGQFAFLTLANLMSRWCRQVSIHAPPVSLIENPFPGFGASLAEASVNLMRASDPFGRFTMESPSSKAVAVHVGAESGSAYHISGGGWIANAGDADEIVTEDLNPLGPSLAACFGCSFALRTALSLPTMASARMSAFNLRAGEHAQNGPRLENVDLGRVLLVGCGAVGAGMAYLLPFINAAPAELTLIDGDAVEWSNLNRVPLFFFRDAAGEHMKTTIVSTYLAARRLSTQIQDGWFVDAVSGGLKVRLFDLVIPAANEQGIHGDIQRQSPPLMIYGTTGPNWEAFLHRHIPLKEDCLSCRFPSHLPPPKTDCAGGEYQETVRPGSVAETGALPFLSLAASTLAVAEIARLGLDGYPMTGNFATLSFKHPQLSPLVRNRSRLASCIDCWHPDIWSTTGGQERRFADLSLR